MRPDAPAHLASYFAAGEIPTACEVAELCDGHQPVVTVVGSIERLGACSSCAELVALRQVVETARELRHLIGGNVDRWTLDGRAVTDTAGFALISLTDYLNDVDRVANDVKLAEETT